MSNTIGAIKIILDQLYTEDSTIALYDDVTHTFSEIRISEKELFGVTDDYNYQYILKNGIGPLSSGFDSRIGGNNVNVSDFTVAIKGLNQWIMKLNELKIQLSGKTIIYYEFEGSDSDSDSVAITQMFTGTIEDRKYNEFETLITAKSSFVLKRNKCLGKTVTETEYEDADTNIVNQTMPVTFGRSDPDNDVYFKLPRLQYRNDILTRDDFFESPTFPQLSLFAVIIKSLIGSTVTWDSIKGNYESNEVEIIFGDSDGSTFKTKFKFPEGLYVKISNDEDSPEGEIRRIEMVGTYDLVTMDGYSLPQRTKKYWLEEYYSLVPKPYQDVAGDGLDELFFALASIMDVLLQYCLDYEESECLISNYKDVFVKESDSMINIGDLSIEQDDSDIPIFNINSSIFNDEIGNAVSNIIVPIEGIEPYESTTKDLTQFGYDPKYKLVNDTYGAGSLVKGVYINENSTGRINSQPTITGAAANAYDRNATTSYKHEVHINLAYAVHYQDNKIVFKITLPTIDSSIVFDKIYLGIQAYSILANDSFEGNIPIEDFDTNSGIDIAYRGFYNLDEIAMSEVNLNVKYPTTFRSLPDKYYNPNTTTKNKNYYFDEHSTVTPVKLTGYKTYEITGITDRETYNNIYEFIIVFNRNSEDYGPIDLYDTIDIRELAIIFEKSITIGSEVYA